MGEAITTIASVITIFNFVNQVQEGEMDVYLNGKQIVEERIERREEIIQDALERSEQILLANNRTISTTHLR
ncbi:MAG: hypothetical protein VW270_09550 [Candidatus Poseidoniales archaeon]